jgi:hypothetical protein
MNLSALPWFDDIGDVLNAAQQFGQDTRIASSAQDSIRLVGVSISDLDASDFIF